MRKLYILLVVSCLTTTSIFSQAPTKPTASEIYHNLQKLNFLGTALYVAAHPDDENTWLISYLANDVKARTAYLSVTRGDGGQNEIGTDIREFLGVIRTQELLAARRIDGGTQFFTRANDFGYSKHPDETLAIWNEEEVTGDIVRAIRKWKPDIIINRFDHRTPGRTHGHHTSSAMLSHTAWDLVNDPNSYPESAAMYGTWQPKRLFFNTYWSFRRQKPQLTEAEKAKIAELEIGTYFPNLGLSTGEIASLSRSRHKSQGFGSTGSRGERSEHLEFLKGDKATNKDDIFEGVNTTWSRVEGGAAIGKILKGVEDNFDFRNPSASVPALMKAYTLINGLRDKHWKSIKKAEIEQLILDCSGLYLEAVADQQSVAAKGAVKVTIEAVNRSEADVKLNSVTSKVIQFPAQFAAMPLSKNKKQRMESVDNTFAATATSTPYWLDQQGSLGMYRVDDASLIGLGERDTMFPVDFNLTIAGTPITITKNITYKFNDPVRGEVYRPFDVLPAATASIPEKVLIFSSEATKDVAVVIRGEQANSTGTVDLQHPEGWQVSPASHAFTLTEKGETKTVVFKVTPPKNQSEGYLKPLIQIGDTFHNKELFSLDYEHIPYQNVLMPSQAKVVRIPIETRGKEIGYINGAGDLIPQSLQQIGYNVTVITPENITSQNLAQFDAIVLGVRVYNFIDEIKFKKEIINGYVANGGTVLAQYNKNFGMVTDDFAPYPLKLSRDRVTDEGSAVDILAPSHAVLNSPNKITQKDFEGWVQERGLYFPNEWAPEFTPILGMADKNSEQTKGSLLVAKHGKGHYIYTGLSFFRELPAGVPGAFRLFANLLSIE